jgi:hypothetical protein
VSEKFDASCVLSARWSKCALEGDGVVSIWVSRMSGVGGCGKVNSVLVAG